MKTFVVTGASRGIGLEITKQLLEQGERVSVLARDPSKSKGLGDLLIKYPDRLSISTCDVNSDAQVSQFAKTLNAPVDVLINNAGIYGGDETFEKLSLEQIEKTITNNAIAPMRVTRALLPWLKKSKDPKVAHITSLMGSIQDNESGGSYGYRMSKAALNMFHKTFSADYREITSLVIHPGWVQTDMGGSGAPVTVEKSAKGILSVIENRRLKDSGKFYDFEGDVLPW